MSNIDISHLFSGNTAFIEHLYERYLQDPDGVDAEWRRYFEALQQEATQADGAGGAQAGAPAPRG